jgi:hypothetical protein
VVLLALLFVLGDSLSASALELSSNWPRQKSTHGARWLARFFASKVGWRNDAKKANGRGCLGKLNKLGMGFFK